MERRDFLKVLGATAAGGVLVDCGGWAVNPPPTVKAGAPDGAGRVLFGRSDYPQLTRVGGAVMVQAAGVSTPFLLMRTGESEYRSTSGICSHKLCPVGFVASRQIIECPCHGAQFNLDGHVLRPPATSGLTPFFVRVDPDTDQLYIDSRGTDMPALVDGKIEFLVDDLGTLSEPDDFFSFTPINMDRPIIVVRYETRRIFAADATCTFAPCVIGYSVDRRRWACPCHSCEFDFDGTVKQGPASRPLRPLPVEFDGSTVRITIPA